MDRLIVIPEIGKYVVIARPITIKNYITIQVRHIPIQEYWDNLKLDTPNTEYIYLDLDITLATGEWYKISSVRSYKGAIGISLRIERSNRHRKWMKDKIENLKGKALNQHSARIIAGFTTKTSCYQRTIWLRNSVLKDSKLYIEDSEVGAIILGNKLCTGKEDDPINNRWNIED